VVTALIIIIVIIIRDPEFVRYTHHYHKWLGIARCRFRGDVMLEASDRIALNKEGDKHIVAIKKIQKAEEGVVNVKATNEVGQMSASARLKVTGMTVQMFQL